VVSYETRPFLQHRGPADYGFALCREGRNICGGEAPAVGRKGANVGLAGNVDLAPDGKRFAVLMPVGSPEPKERESHVKLMFNFSDEVRRRVAGQGGMRSFTGGVQRGLVSDNPDRE
jgi:hypothetical protein